MLWIVRNNSKKNERIFFFLTIKDRVTPKSKYPLAVTISKKIKSEIMRFCKLKMSGVTLQNNLNTHS